MKKVLMLLALLIVSLVTIGMVNAATLPVSIEELKVDGNKLSKSSAKENLYVEEGKSLKVQIKVKNTGTTTVKDMEVEAALKGSKYSVDAQTSLFDLDAGDSRWISLSLSLPKNLDKDLYLLRIWVTDKNSDEVKETYNLKVNPIRNGVGVKDVVFSPGTTVKAGHSLIADVLVDNFGAKDEKDVKVTLSIPALGVSTADYVSKIENDDKKVSEPMFLRLPLCAKAGTYDAKVTVAYDDADKTVTKTYKLNVLANDRCTTSAATGGKLVLTVGPETQNVVANKQAVYPIALTNAGTETKTYVLELTAGSWATSKLSDNLVVLAPGKTKVAYAYLTPSKDVTAGQKVATLSVKSGNNVLKTVYLKANVVKESKSLSLRNGLEIALVVLVVILVIVGLILGFSRLRKDDEEEVLDEEGKTYY